MTIYTADQINSVYFSEDGLLKAEVIKVSGTWGGRYWKDQVFQTDVLFEGKNEHYAEDACENYVLGINKI